MGTLTNEQMVKKLAALDARARELGYRCEGGRLSVDVGPGHSLEFDIGWAEVRDLPEVITWKVYRLGVEDGEDNIRHILRDVLKAAPLEPVR